MGWTGKWDGGRIFTAQDGTKTFYIRRMVGGKPYNFCTGATELRAALKHLDRFEADPDAYSPNGSLGGTDLLITDKLIDEYVDWALDEKGNDKSWTGKTKSYLKWWREKLKGDLRKLQLRDFQAALKDAKNKNQRIRVIKAFYGWLRRMGQVEMAQDHARELQTTQVSPAQWTKSKVIPISTHEAVLKKLEGRWKDLVLILSGTGWHISELLRFCRDGRIDPLPEDKRRTNVKGEWVVGAGLLDKKGKLKPMPKGNEPFGVLVCPRRKSGEEQRTLVSFQVIEAADRQLVEKGFDPGKLYTHLKEACLAAKVTPYSPGMYRHTVATWAVEQGASPEAVSAYLGHKSKSTTMKFYATLAVVPKVPTLS